MPYIFSYDESAGGEIRTPERTSAIDLEKLDLSLIRSFKAWLKLQNNGHEHTKAIIQYYTKYFRDYKLTSVKELVKFLNSVDGSRRYCVLTLRTYLKFLVETGETTDEVIAPYLKILKNKKRKQYDNYIPTDEEVVKAYNNLTDGRTKLFFEVLTYSGIRVTELYKLFSEFEPHRLIKNDKFAKYPLNYFRGQKKVFYVYLPISTANKLARFYKINSMNMTKWLTKSGLSPKYLRKWFYNFLIYNNVPESIADYIEGRATQTVGSMHYLGKTKQADFWYEKIIEILWHALK